MRRAVTVLVKAMVVALVVGVLTGCEGLLGSEEEGPRVVATPIISPESGTYERDQVVEIRTVTGGATIFYTVNGDDPTTTSTEYTGPIQVDGDGTSVTIKAIAVNGEYEDSGVAEATYTISYPELRYEYTFDNEVFEVSVLNTEIVEVLLFNDSYYWSGSNEVEVPAGEEQPTNYLITIQVSPDRDSYYYQGFFLVGELSDEGSGVISEAFVESYDLVSEVQPSYERSAEPLRLQVRTTLNDDLFLLDPTSKYMSIFDDVTLEVGGERYEKTSDYDTPLIEDLVGNSVVQEIEVSLDYPPQRIETDLWIRSSFRLDEINLAPAVFDQRFSRMSLSEDYQLPVTLTIE